MKQNILLYQVCVIQHRNWPLRSTILNAHDTNASPDGLCTRTHTNEAFSCWFCCKSFRVDLEIDLVWCGDRKSRRICVRAENDSALRGHRNRAGFGVGC